MEEKRNRSHDQPSRKQIFIGVVGVAVAVVSYQLYKKFTTNTNPLSGPTASNKNLGNFTDMAKAGSVHQYLEELNSKYGSIGAFWWGKQRVAYITSQHVLLNEQNKKLLDKLSDRPPFLFDGFKPLITKYSIQYINGAEFKAKYHHVLLAAFHKQMTTKIPIMTKITQQIVNEWTQSIDPHSKTAVVNMKHYAFVFSSKSIIYACFGEDISTDTCNTIIEGYEYAWNEMEKRLIDGIPSDAARDAKFEEGLNKIRNPIKAILKQRNDIDTNENSFINCVLKQKKLYDTEDKILADSITSVVGGTHTTGEGLTWLFYYVARDVTVQEKMFKEIKHHFDVNDNIGDIDAQTLFDKLNRLTYCRQVITETLRVSSLAPWAARVNYNEDMVLNRCDGTGGKVKIPKGMAFIIGQGVALNDRNVFQNPNKFDPERWNRNHLKNNKILQQSQDAIFGGLGGRMCPGWLFFRTEALIFVVGIMLRFKFEMVNDEVIDIKYGLVSAPKQDVKVKVTKR